MSYSAGLLNVTNLTANGAAGSLKATTATVTNLTAANVSATNIGLTNNLGIAGTLSANKIKTNIIGPNVPVAHGGVFGSTDWLRTVNPKNPFGPGPNVMTPSNSSILTSTSTVAANVAAGFCPYGLSTYIGGVDPVSGVEYFADIRFGYGVGTPLSQKNAQTLAQTSGLRGMPCAAYVPTLNNMTRVVDTNPFNIHCMPTAYPGIPIETSDLLGDLYTSPDKMQQFYQTQSEDCLMLDVFRPNGTNADNTYRYSNLPVMVFVHGGSLTNFNRKYYNGIAQKMITEGNDCIIVMIDYRLAFMNVQSEAFRVPINPSGGIYSSFPSLKQFAGCCGNCYSTDVIVSLQWVQAHIANFGGDRNNVTLYGLSAGGIIVETVRQSPLSYPIDSSGNKGRLFKQYMNNSGTYAINSVLSINNYFEGSNPTNMTPDEFGKYIPQYFLGGPVGTNLPVNPTNLEMKYVIYATYGYGYIDTSYNYWLDGSGGVATDAGFKTWYQSLTTAQMQLLTLGFFPPQTNVKAGAPAAVTSAGFIPQWWTQFLPLLDGKNVVYRSFAEALGTNPEGTSALIYDGSSSNVPSPNAVGYYIDSSNYLLPDMPWFVNAMGQETNLWEPLIALGAFKNTGMNGYNFTPGYWFGSWNTPGPSPTTLPVAGAKLLPSPNGGSTYQLSYAQFHMTDLWCRKFARMMSEVYYLPGQIRKNQSVTWLDAIKGTIDGSANETVTQIFDVFDVWYPPTAIADVSGGQVTAISVSSIFPGFGYLSTDASNVLVTISGGGGSGATAYVTGVTLVSNYEGVDASGNTSTIVDYSGNVIPAGATYKITGITMISGGSGYTSKPQVLVAPPRNALRQFPPGYPYQDGNVPPAPGQNTIVYPSQEGVAILMQNDVWSVSCFDFALRSADGSSNSYITSNDHFMKGQGAKVYNLENGAEHITDAVIMSNFWEQLPNTNAWSTARSLIDTNFLVTFGFILGGSGDSTYTPTNADFSIAQNLRSIYRSFMRTGVPALSNGTPVPSFKAGGLGQCYHINSDASGNVDTSVIESLANCNSGHIGKIFSIIYGQTVEQISAASLAASPGYYVMPK